MSASSRYFRIQSANPSSLHAPSVTVEIVISHGIPRHTVVGLPQGAVRESLDRIRAALASAGYTFPRGAITVNLAPADTRKDGSAFDLPIALGILAADAQISTELLRSSTWLIMGELTLDARVQPVEGVMPAILDASKEHLNSVILPRGNLPEATAFPGLHVGAVRHLREAVEILEGTVDPVTIGVASEIPPPSEAPDFSTVIGQDNCVRTLALAAAGGHNMLLSGPPGCGKTLMVRCMEGILPSWSRSLALEATCLHSLRKPGIALLERRPFRRPHHSVSAAGLLGGGTPLRPGEVSLAHGGILFLDELPEFHPGALEGLREPLEEGKVTLSRANGVEEFPSDFQLIAAMNPCPCGYAGSPDRRCSCSDRRRKLYRARISGPLLDRIDMHVPVMRVDPLRHLDRSPIPSSDWAVRVETTRHRLGTEPPVLDKGEEETLIKTVASLGVSMRTVAGIRRIARTVAAFEEADRVQRDHLAEAIRVGGQSRREGAG